jgi:hypothetical protein
MKKTARMKSRTLTILEKLEMIHQIEEITIPLIKEHKAEIWHSKEGKLDFSDSKFNLKSIDPVVLQKSKLLKEKIFEINLRYNSLKNIDLFCGMKHLKILDATSNFLENIKLYYPSLSELHLSKNRLTMVNKTIKICLI